MATQEKKHIKTYDPYEDIAGYRFVRYAEWLSQS
jgi:hypothetical protein